MKRTRMLGLIVTLALVAAPGVSQENGAVPKEIRDVTQVFTARRMVVKGEGVAPSDRPLGSAQKRLLALRAAKVVALRELAETLAGVRISGQTCVQDAAVRSDEVRAAVDGLVRGAEVVHQSYDPATETATVYVQLGLDGPNGVTGNLLPTILQEHAAPVAPAKPYAPAAAAAPPSGVQPADALIIDATGRNFRPALINRIVTAQGSVLFEPSKIAPEILAKKGCGDYTSDVGKAKAILSSHGDKHPLVVTAAGVQRSTDVQVSDTDAAKIFSADQKTSFLEGANVVFVL